MILYTYRSVIIYYIYMKESSELSEIFPKRLKTARLLRDLSQSELAQKAGLQAASVSHFETGLRKPSFDNLKRLADALTITTDYLLGRSESMDSSNLEGIKLFRHYSRLPTEHQEMADSFLKMLADKAEQKRNADN